MSYKTIQRTDALLKRLADGQFHSGESIAEELQVSRTAVWKLIQKLESWQIKIYSLRGKGYKIPGGLELINQAVLTEHLSKHNQLFKQVDVLTSIDSTADYLAKQWQQQPSVGRVCIAEHQTAGRGRKGRPWISPFAANLYFSIGVELPLGLSALGGLSLAIGISLTQSLNQLTNQDVKIKWPNDLLVDNKKLAGILVEASGDNNDASFLNIGIGLNWNMQQEQAGEIDQPWLNLKSLINHKSIDRTQILALLLADLDAALIKYSQSGFASFSDVWPQVSANYKLPVVIHLPNGQEQGTEIGVEANGALKLQTESGIKVFHSGEVSLRKS
jgi:BirA family transcriptional regulator, biotin operon repressor / biotin---[acetyl-CoA-carboxylase] ligase